MSNNERCFLAKQYLRYIRLLDKCEYFNREESDEAMYLKIYNLLHTKKGIGNIICKLDDDFRCYRELFKNSPYDKEYKNIYLNANNLKMMFKNYASLV